MDVSGKTLPLNKEEFSSEDWTKLTANIGFSAVELIDVANALENQNEEWLKNNQSGLPEYYRALAQNLIAVQQVLFGYNVTGNPDVQFKE